MRRGYRSSGWSDLSLRFVGSLVVFAIAALSGAVIGGVGVYIINDAINAPPAAQASADGPAPAVAKPAKAQDSKSPGVVAQPQSAPKPAAAPATPQVRPQNDSRAATRDVPKDTPGEDAAKQSADSARHGAAATQAEAKASDDANAKSGPAHAATDNQPDAARKKAATAGRKRVTATSARRFAPESSEQAQSGAQRAYYDYYDRDDPRGRRNFGQARQRIIVRRQDNSDDGWNYRNEGAVYPAQPRQSFFGFFGRDRYNREDHW